MKLPYHLSAMVWLLASPATAQRYRAMDLMPAPTLSPRYYQPASPVQAALGKRQEAACKSAEHPCNDIGTLGAAFCCPDDTYCIVDPLTGTKPACCAIGSVCGSSCSEEQYECVGTSTVTVAITITITSAAALSTTTSTSTYPACCPRRCAQTSMFACPQSLGGGCCSYGQTCASASRCLWTSTSTGDGDTLSTVVSQVPAGCTTSQIACPSSMGGGCCGATQSCTWLSGAPRCAGVGAAATVSTAGEVSRDPDAGLGVGGKVGIAVGVVAAVVAVAVAVGIWLCLRRRRRRRSEDEIPAFVGGAEDGPLPLATSWPSPTDPPTGSPVRWPRRTGIGGLLSSPGGGGGGGAGTGAGVGVGGGGGGGGGGKTGSQEMVSNESNTDMMGRLRGLTADYFGPEAVAGPFTEAEAVAAAAGGGSWSWSWSSSSPGGTNPDRAVPMSPQGPDDITAPVEIDSRKRQVSDTTEGRVELDGAEPRRAWPARAQGWWGAIDPVSPYTPSSGE